MDYRIQHFLWSLPLCRAGLLNMLPHLLKEYVEVQILHKWNSRPCSGLYFTQLVFQHWSLYLLFSNICAKKTRQLRSECTIKRFLEFKWAELVTFTEPFLSSSISLVELFLFRTKQFFCDPTKILSMLFFCMFLPNKCTSSLLHHTRDPFSQMLPNLLKESYGSMHLTSIM